MELTRIELVQYMLYIVSSETEGSWVNYVSFQLVHPYVSSVLKEGII